MDTKAIAHAMPHIRLSRRSRKRVREIIGSPRVLAAILALPALLIGSFIAVRRKNHGRIREVSPSARPSTLAELGDGRAASDQVEPTPQMRNATTATPVSAAGRSQDEIMTDDPELARSRSEDAAGEKPQ